jgi:hypothetical protein
MATCSRCKAWMGETTGPTPPIPGTLVCDRCRNEAWIHKSNRSTAAIMVVCAIIFLADALRGTWNRTDPRGGNPAPPPEPLHVDPGPGDDGAEPEELPRIPAAQSATIMSLDF